ncbi:MAG: energy transducer TonB [Deltaproteobacteria bacterium]|nr:energy transducer TonB [Deltaproteobacteria bacterium]
MLEIGISVGIHAAGLLSILLLTMFSASHETPDTPFVTVHLVEMAANSAGELEPFPGTENGKTLQTAAMPGDIIRPSRPVFSQTRAVMERKPRKVGKRQQPVNISGKTSEPEPETASVPAPSESQDPAPSQISESTDAAGSKGSGPAVQGTFENEAGSGNGLGAGPGNGSGNGSGAGGALTGTGGTGGAFDLKQVDQPPVPIRKVDPEFPPAARKLGVSGSVTIKFLVKADGSVIKDSVLEANPEGLFDQCALDAIRKWHFTPGIYQGKAVATWVILPVQFRLSR